MLVVQNKSLHMKRSRTSCSTFSDPILTAQPKSFRTETVIAASAEDLQKWLFENWDNAEISMKKVLNLIQERFFQRTARTDGRSSSGFSFEIG